MKYLSTGELSKKWNISTIRITILAKNGRIPGAIQVGSRWLIPDDSDKPIDGRFKNQTLKENAQNFRFPFFAFEDIESFNPPLSIEEIKIKDITEAFLECRFEDANKQLSGVLNTTNIYIKIPALYIASLLSFVNNKYLDFLSYYKEINDIFIDDFPYKKEMKTFLHELDATLGIGDFFIKDFHIDSNYNYHETYIPFLTALSSICFLFSSDKKFTKKDLIASEINSIYLDKVNSPINSQTMHLYLGFAYGSIGEKELADAHFKKGFDIALKYNAIWLPAIEYFYYGKLFNDELIKLPNEFLKRYYKMSNFIHECYENFFISSSGTNPFDNIGKNRFLYYFYAVKGYSNKEVAELLNVSENTVNKVYSSIYSALFIKNKKELVEYYIKSITKR